MIFVSSNKTGTDLHCISVVFKIYLRMYATLKLHFILDVFRAVLYQVSVAIQILKCFSITDRLQISLIMSNKFKRINPAGIYLLKVNNRNTRTRWKICSNLTIKTLDANWHHSGAFIFNFEHISHLVLVFPFLTLNM